MHLRYLRYVLLHKWHVFVATCRLGIPWLGLVHDFSKFTPREWTPYARYFFGPNRGQDNPVPSDVQEAFDRAWLAHIHRNAHHWQHWVLQGDGGTVRVLPMPDRYRREMLADWIGAGRAQAGKSSTRDWYMANRSKMQLHADTRAWVERHLL